MRKTHQDMGRLANPTLLHAAHQPPPSSQKKKEIKTVQTLMVSVAVTALLQANNVREWYVAIHYPQSMKCVRSV